MEQGKYIVIEGHDAIGKSTQVGRIRERLGRLGIESVEFHEPGGTPVADAIRDVTKNGNLERDAMTDVLLFSASRHEIWNSHAIPALEVGKWVVAARNYWSTVAYQGFGGGVLIPTIEQITRLATDERYIKPDVGVILSLDDEEERKRRMSERGELANPDTFEMRDDFFQNAVRYGYLRYALEHDIKVLDANKPIDDVTDDIWQTISEKLL